MGTTTTFGWEVPDDTDYVQQGYAAIDTLGQSIDTTLNVVTGSTGLGDVPKTGLTFIVGSNFSAQSSVSFNNVFSSRYDNYVIVTSSMTQTAAGNGIYIRMRAGGVDNSGATAYRFNGIINNTSALQAYNPAATSSGLVTIGSATTNGNTIQMHNPAQALRTYWETTFMEASSSYYWAINGYHDVATAYDGFTLTVNSGTFSGVVRVYGYRNS
jgi:hypothetical protein